MQKSYSEKYTRFNTVGYQEFDTVQIYEYTFKDLPSNMLFDYGVMHRYSEKHKARPTHWVYASFRTPPSLGDIAGGKVTEQVFYSFGDNRPSVPM